MIIIVVWMMFYIIAKALKFEEKGWVIQPYFALYKSTRLNNLIKRLAQMSPKTWKIVGNIGIAASIGQVLFLSWILISNLWNLVYVPEQATPVQPLIPGVTISYNSLPWFLVAAGVVIFTHELAHGIMCNIEGVPVKTSAILFAVITFGGAVEPDEESLNEASLMSKLRIFAGGSIINLMTGLLMVVLLVFLGRAMPFYLAMFVWWTQFVALNLSMMNMLPIGPFDGGQMWREYTNKYSNGKLFQSMATYGFLALILGNIGLSLMQMGWTPI
jgi:membrane-associated protease RseP (regulator of RpoE activity)